MGARGVSLSERTTFGIGGRADEFHAPASIAELRAVLALLASEGREPFVLGGGANTLFPDGVYRRPVISTDRLDGIEVEGRCALRVGAGARLPSVVREALRAGLGGLEGFVGIPGSCGGAVRMNAGGSGWALGERVRELGVVSLDGGPLEVLSGNDVDWAYRTANLPDHMVVWTRFALVPSSTAVLRRRARDLMRRKARTQPVRARSAGCAFRNPPGRRAGEIIESLGFKGRACGGARISERHANFIVNETGSATAADVHVLLERIRTAAREQFGVPLETELVLA